MAARQLDFRVDAKRGGVSATAYLMTGNKIVYAAKGLHIDRYNKQKATVEIRFQSAESDDYLSYDDIDIKDREQRNKLANAARKHLEGPKGSESPFGLDIRDWTESVNQHLMDDFCLRFPLALFEAQGARWASGGGEITAEAMLIEDFLQEAGGHILYGPKGSGKTEMGILIARCLERQIPLFGHVRRPCKVMFLQLERAEPTFLRAVQVVNRALGLPVDEPIFMRVERGRSFAGMIDAIATDVDKNKIDVLMVDSLSRMTEGGSLKDDNTANPIMDRLNAVAPCHFDLAHTSWDGNGDPAKAHVFGSIHFGNAADVVHQIVRQRVEQRVAGLLVHTRDANAFAPEGKKYFRAQYDDLGLLSFEAVGADMFPTLGMTTGLSNSERHEMIWQSLAGQGHTVEQLSELTGIPQKEVDNTLRGDGGRNFIQVGKGPSKGGRAPILWGRDPRRGQDFS